MSSMEESGNAGRFASGKVILVRGCKHPDKTGITVAMKQILTVKNNLAVFMFEISMQNASEFAHYFRWQGWADEESMSWTFASGTQSPEVDRITCCSESIV